MSGNHPGVAHLSSVAGAAEFTPAATLYFNTPNVGVEWLLKQSLRYTGRRVMTGNHPGLASN
jgi:hypothetical protein